MRTLAIPVALIALLGCDPASFKRFPVETSAATSPLEQVLDQFEQDHLGTDFFRVNVPADLADVYRDRGYRVLRWYDRDPEPTSQRGSFVYLAVLAELESSRIELASVAFPSFGEPHELTRLRRDLSSDLCRHGFRVKDSCDA